MCSSENVDDGFVGRLTHYNKVCKLHAALSATAAS